MQAEGYVSADYLTVKTGEKPDNTTSNTASAKGAAVVAYGKQFIGTPYVWGGTNLNTGVDWLRLCIRLFIKISASH